MIKKAETELCQAQAQVGLTSEAELEVFIHLLKIISDSTLVDLQMFG
jgi:hypothetical protein